MAIKTFTTGEVLTAADTNLYLANAGLVYVTSGSTTLTTSAYLVQNCFVDSSYTDYRINIQTTSASTTNTIEFRFLDNATPASSNYYGSGIGANFSSDATVYFQRTNNASQLSITNNTSSAGKWISFDVVRPHQAAVAYFANGAYFDTSGQQHFAWGGYHNSATAYNGFTLAMNTGTAAIRFTVYGYRKA